MAECIHRGSVVFRKGQRIHLGEMSYIFTCPGEMCEYVMTSTSEEGAKVIRNMHMRICHPEKIAGILYRESFNRDIPDYVQRAFEKVDKS